MYVWWLQLQRKKRKFCRLEWLLITFLFWLWCLWCLWFGKNSWVMNHFMLLVVDDEPASGWHAYDVAVLCTSLQQCFVMVNRWTDLICKFTPINYVCKCKCLRLHSHILTELGQHWCWSLFLFIVTFFVICLSLEFQHVSEWQVVEGVWYDGAKVYAASFCKCHWCLSKSFVSALYLSFDQDYFLPLLFLHAACT